MDTFNLRRLAAGTAIGTLALCSLGLGSRTLREQEPVDRESAAKLMRDGNWQEAFNAYSRLALDPATDPAAAAGDLQNAIQCLGNLGRVADIDEFRERAADVHAAHWEVLKAVAESYLAVEHYGSIVAGEFQRGPHRGGTAKVVQSYERDRVRALQLMQQGMEHLSEQANAEQRSAFYMSLAGILMGNRGFQEGWRLQYLSNLDKLPDYEEGYYPYYYVTNPGAPVDLAGNPVFHETPAGWHAAETDGQRWRWALHEAALHNPRRAAEVDYHLASFLHHQFGVQTMQEYSWFFGRGAPSDEDAPEESGTYALHTLGEHETIAKLATGIKRFTLPAEHNFIKIFQKLAREKSHGSSPFDTLAQIFENRRQYPKAAQYWRQAIESFGNTWRRQRLEQIVGNWGRFEPVMTQPAGAGATVDFRFRNGRKVAFEAYDIKVERLLADVKAYIKSSPGRIEWNKQEVGNLGYRLVEQNETEYIGRRVASWDLDLEPRPQHFDSLMTVSTPLQKAGAYLLVARMADGNASRIVMWLADTAIVRKDMDQQTYLFVADAVTGTPLPRATVEFFGYRQEWVRDNNTRGRGRHVIHTRNFAEYTDEHGQVLVKERDRKSRYRWLITATTRSGRLAYLGFTGLWHGRYHDSAYNARKSFVITDRPVYRPGQPVRFKFWINRARYDLEGRSDFAGQTFSVRVDDPRGEKIFEKTLQADEYGGFHGALELEKNATLGVYRVYVPHHGGGQFRVEEYKKPEFEVTVEAPSEPVRLGDNIEAKIRAKYYFGAAVTQARVKYKILRSSHSAQWYPVRPWDWFYGPGYWWFAYDYEWYPGWREWGCVRPLPWWWWQWYPREQPEVVAEAEVPVGADGTVVVEIDTALAKAIHGDTDHRYDITAEVTDRSRRTIVGTGQVLVARRPFKVYAWVDRGYYRVGDDVLAQFSAHTLDRKPVKGQGLLRLLKISYREGRPVENEVQRWDLDTDDQGRAEQQIKASRAGQYRLSYRVTDAKDRAIEGGYVFVVRGPGFDGSEFRFNDLELIADRREYAPGQRAELMINTNRADSTVVLFVRPVNGVYLPPKVLNLQGKSVLQEIEVLKKDMPNFFVEALTISDGAVHTETREIIVPPQKRVLNVEVRPSAEEYRPGAPARVAVKVTDHTGEPVKGSVVLSMYDKSVEYVSGGSNVPDIKEFFWKWRRQHQPRSETSLTKGGHNLVRSGELAMAFLGVFGHSVVDELADGDLNGVVEGGVRGRARKARLGQAGEAAADSAPGAPVSLGAPMAMKESAGRDDALRPEEEVSGQPPLVAPTVRRKFADTALWVAELETAGDGTAEVELAMPENLTTWKTRVWAITAGTRVGEGLVEVVTTKKLLVRLQAPRFFTQKDEVVLSANVHNYLDQPKRVRAVLEVEGGTLEPLSGSLTQRVLIEAQGETRVDWRVKVVEPGEAVVRMKALSDVESDAMEMRFPVYVHGMLKTESYCGVIRPEDDRAEFMIDVPAERRPQQSRLELRYSPTLAMAMVDALPYMVDYPYGCTEQTLNRFLPTVITHNILQDMDIDLEEVRRKRTNLNAQEIGDDVTRARQWGGVVKPFRNAVFDAEAVRDMVKAGLERLTSMQCSDGGWGWFSGWAERSSPHTTAVVVHGLQIARAADVALVPGVLERGIEWLKGYQEEQVRRLKNAPTQTKPWKHHADNLDAFVYMVLVDEGVNDADMGEFLHRDRNELAVYTKAMLALASHRLGQLEQRDMLIRNVEQFLVQDDENHTVYLRLPESSWWWAWYGSEYEAHAYYLKLLAVVEPGSEKAARLVKYLLNNRKNATYWKSTRDTALVVEAFADYLEASGEAEPDMTVEVRIDGEPVKKVPIDKSNLFTFDNRVVLQGAELGTGSHHIEVIRTGSGPVYFNAYLTNFTLEDPITSAGLEIKVQRRYYELTPEDKRVKARGDRGQAVDHKVEKYERRLLENLEALSSGDLVEIELEIDSKNDYEYIMFEDLKPAGFEPVEVRSGYNDEQLRAYMELRDERVTFFVRVLPRGRHSVSYRMRAEIPGTFSALPTKASAMYAPELKANSDEIKLSVYD